VRSIDTDLSISPEDILFSPSTAKPGEKVTVNIRIRNVGNKVSSGNYRVHLSIDKTPDYFSDDPNKLELSLLNGSSLIQPGGYIDYKTDINIPAWTTPMQYPIYVDVTDESKDKIIGNNSTRTFFTVSSKYGSGKM
jgi:uncharacterized membrane protein